MSSEKRVFHTLDGMRGVAALAVVSFHAADLFGPLRLPSAYLAVDLFFALSGFVIAHAYGERLASGLSLRSFMWTRLIRLWPLYLLGTAASLALFAASMLFGSFDTPMGPFVTAAVLAILFLPAPILSGGAMYPLNGPAWSLFYELAVNLGAAAVWRWLSVRILAAVVGLGAIGLAAWAYLHGSLDAGYDLASWPVATARVVFAFFAGVLLYRLQPKLPKVSPWLIVGTLVAVLAVPAPAEIRWLYDTVAAVMVFPALIAFGARTEPRSSALFAAAGRASYALYVLHVPALGWLRTFEKVGHVQLPPIAGGVLVLALLVAAALVADRFYDAPVRRLLTRRPAEAQPKPRLAA